MTRNTDGEGAYGCHVDLEPGEKPDGCVIEYEAHRDCIYATFSNGRKRRSPHTCKYWRKIDDIVNKADPAEAERAAIVKFLRNYADWAGHQSWNPLVIGWARWWRSVRIRRADWDRAVLRVAASAIERKEHQEG